jgi:hypothetical protein
MKNILTKQRYIYSGWMWLTFLVAACCPDVDQNLNPNILTWAPYLPNQRVVFRNENQDSVIFVVQQKQRTETGYEQVCGSYDIQTAETVLVNQADTTFQFKITLTQEVLVKLDSYHLQPPAKNLSALFNSVSEQYVSDDWRDRYLKEINLNGTVYQNVLHVYGFNTPTATSFIDIFYGKDKGLLAFSNANGRFYRQ